MIKLYLAVGISLIIICLVVRDRTAFRLSRLRAEFMALRNEEKRAAKLLSEEKAFISRISDDSMRAASGHAGEHARAQVLDLRQAQRIWQPGHGRRCRAVGCPIKRSRSRMQSPLNSASGARCWIRIVRRPWVEPT